MGIMDNTDQSPNGKSSDHSYHEQIFGALNMLLKAVTWTEVREMLKNNPLLLNEDTQLLLNYLLSDVSSHNDDVDLKRMLKYIQELVLRSRKIGVNNAFAQIKNDYELQLVFNDFHRPPAIGEIPLRIQLCQQAIKLCPPKRNSILWAWFQFFQGINFIENPFGNLQDNFEQAIRHFNKSLTIFTKEDHPDNWAGTKQNLAVAYLHRIKGNRANNIELAIQHCKEALNVFTVEAFPNGWAQIQINLASAFIIRIKGDKGNNIEQAIVHCNCAFKVYTQQTDPINHAIVLSNLGTAYLNCSNGIPTENIELAIQCLIDALDVLTLDVNPEFWSLAQNSLAIAYEHRIKGNKSRNVERAIYHYKETLRYRQLETFPREWAIIQMNLAVAYKESTKENRAETIEKAIYYYKEALKVYDPKNYPREWGLIQNNIAIIYFDRSSRFQEENIECAIEHCMRSLEAETLRDFPELWADTQMLLGSFYHARIRGDLAENKEKAIFHSNEAMKVFTQRTFPTKRAATNNSLGCAYNDRTKGVKAENIERSIKYFKEALKVRTFEAFPESWAETQNNLATAYLDRIKGDIAENIDMAIALLNEALKVRTFKESPQDWALTKMNLANAYQRRINGDKNKNIETAIRYYDEALMAFTLETTPIEWAATQNNLGITYKNRIHGDRSENIEQAIECYLRALVVRKLDTTPFYWAGTQNNLATAFRERIKGVKAENLENSIKHYSEALKVYSKEDYPEYWAAIMNNLAGSYFGRINGDRAENIEKSIQYNKESLTIRTKALFPKNWATTQNNIAGNYEERIVGNRNENIEQGIYHYKEALTVFTEEAFPENWAMTQYNIAKCYEHRILEDRTNNIEKAIYHYNNALKVLRPDSNRELYFHAASELGNIYFEEKRWNEAAEAYKLAAKAAEIWYQASLFTNRNIELSKIRGLYVHAAYSLAKSNQMREAAIYMERGRARILSDMLARNRENLEEVIAKDPDASCLFLDAVQHIENVESMVQKSDIVVPSQNDVQFPRLFQKQSLQMQDKINKAIERIRRVQGYEDFLKEPDWNDIKSAIMNEQPIVYLITISVGGLAIVISGSKDHLNEDDIKISPIWLDELTEDYLLELIGNFSDTKQYGWLGAYQLWLSALKELMDESSDEKSIEDYICAKDRWLDTIEMVTNDLYKVVMGQVSNYLLSHGFNRAFLIVSGYLALLPLHAAWKEENGKRYYVMDNISFAYAPSANSLKYAIQIAKTTQAEKLIAIDEPMPVNASPLDYSHSEVTAISSYFEESILFAHEDAKRESVLKALPLAQAAHFSCHGEANWTDPANSGLLMANNQMLTIKDLSKICLKGGRIATLSACETGVIGMKLPDEVICLPSAFLQTGFAGILSSLWTVPDKSTALLMISFYKLWKEDGISPVKALNEAQKYIRSIESFKSPFYWAAFYFTGL